MSHNFINNDPAKDRANQWRGAVLLLLIGSVIGSFVWQKSGPVTSESFSKIIQPLQELGGKEGGDIVVDPPQPVKPKLPQLIGEMLPVDEFSAHSIIVKDRGTNAVLYRKNEYHKWPMASITKLMSALVILEKNPNWATSTQVIADDIVDTHMYAGDTYTLEEFWNAALIGSSNKAILSLADAAGWPREAFVERMNQKAWELGMLDTNFVDATGLGDKNISTASDIIMLLNEAMKFEKIKESLLSSEYNLYSQERKKKHHMWNTDWLLLGWIEHDFSEFYGGKTGYILASRYNFIMRVGNEESKVLDVVVLGANSHENRFIEARDVAQWAFENFKWPD